VPNASSQFSLSGALDHLVGYSYDPSNIRVELAALIYLRWADFRDAELEAIAAFDGLEYVPTLPAALHWRSWHLLRSDDLRAVFIDRLPLALETLANARNSSLATHLHRISPAVKALGRLPSNSLEILIQWLADLPFETHSDRRALLEVFDQFAFESFHNEREIAQYRTPSSISRLIVEIAAPTSGERIYDPCFGSAGLLVFAHDYAVKKEKDRTGRANATDLSVYGIEINPDAFVIGLTRLALAGVYEPQLELGNSLERPAYNNPVSDGFDVVLSNPPWGMRTNMSGLDHFPIRTADATGLFIQHAVMQLRPGGRAVIVVPQGFLFRGGAEKRLRRMLLEQYSVEAIIALPPKAFLPYTAVQASLLVIRRSGPTKHVRMIDAESLFEKGKGRQPVTIRQALAEELAERVRRSEPGKDAWDVDPLSLADNDWDLTPKRRDQTGLLGILESLRSELEIVALKDCCHIMPGNGLKRRDLFDSPPIHFSNSQSPDEYPQVPYIRIKDIQHGQAAKGSTWISENITRSIDPISKLKSGDVLLSKSGTIGKVGVVRNGAVGAIAADGLFVLRPDPTRLDPHFLSAYLDSNECRAWLDANARGATIRHLARRVIDGLPLPLPPLQVQQRVVAEQRAHGADMLAYLTQLLLKGEGDAIVEWIDAALRHLALGDRGAFEPDDIKSLLHSQVLGGAFTNVRNLSAHQYAEQNKLTPWVLNLSPAVEVLRNLGDVPRGPAFYSLLEQSLTALREAEASISGHLPNANKARSLTGFISNRLSAAMAALISDTQIAVSCDANTLKPGELVSIEITLENRGSLPIREVRFATTPNWGQERVGYLPEAAAKTFTISGTTPTNSPKFSLHVEWTGLSLNGQPVQGKREIPFDIIETESNHQRELVDIGGSPYVCGDPVRPDRSDVFFGRAELLEQIRRQVIQSGNVVLLEGNRRAGKSSILCHLEGSAAVPGWLGVYCSLQGAEGSKHGAGVPTVEVFREMANSIAKGIQALGGDTPLPNNQILPAGRKIGISKACRDGISEDSAFSDFRDYMEVVLEILQEHGLSLLLMLDEFDKLQEGIDSHVTSPQVPENIRFLVQTYPRFSAILTGARRLQRLREEYWSALYGLGTRFGVSSLLADAARRLICEPVKGRLTFSDEAVDRAIYLTARQPYLLQCLCNRIFDMAAQLKLRSVTLDLVNEAAHALVEDNEHFASLWDYAGTDRRRFLLALCHHEAAGPDPLRLRVIQELLIKHGIEISDDALIADLEFLRELELIELIGEHGGGHYNLAIPLMGFWIEGQQDFAALLTKARSETEDENERA